MSDELIEKFDFKCAFSYDENKYIQMTNGYILEIGYVECPSNPFGSVCVGDYGEGDNYSEAYDSAWSKMSDKTKDALKEKVSQHLLDDANIKKCKNGEFSFEAMTKYCEENQIDLSDILLYKPYFNGIAAAVIFIEPETFECYFDEKFNELTFEQKQCILEESVSVLKEWDVGHVYYWSLYDKNGDIVDNCDGFYGTNSIKNVVANFENWIEDIKPLKDLGSYCNISNCMYANRNKIEER